MTISMTGVVTGGAQTGFTSPTYTGTSDWISEIGKQSVVTATGGTQAGVLTHTPANPFTWTFLKPKVLKTLSGANPVTGVISPVPFNRYKLIVRKGLIPYSSAVPRVGNVTCEFNIPAGCELTDPANLRAMVSALVGLINTNSAGIGDTLVTSVIG